MKGISDVLHGANAVPGRSCSRTIDLKDATFGTDTPASWHGAGSMIFIGNEG